MSIDRGLKRGLKDLSPIFNVTPSIVHPSFPSSFSSIEERIHSFIHFTEFGTDDIRQAFYSSLLAECRQRSFFSKVIEIRGEITTGTKTDDYFPQAIAKQCISWEEFREGKKMPLHGAVKSAGMKAMTLFDIPAQEAEKFKDFIPLIDHWVFALEPKIEQLNECYRMIKGTRILNEHIKYHLLFKTDIEDLSVSFLKNGMHRLLYKNLRCEAFDLGSWGNRGVSVTVQWDVFFEQQHARQNEHASQKDSFLYYVEHGQAVNQRAV